MGTNYFHITNSCDNCERCDEKHIGKSSCGWQFCFQGHEGIASYKDWKDELGNGVVINEYGTEVTLKQFVEIVEGKQAGKNHYDECRKDGHCMDREWKDDEGYSFSGSDFS